MLKASQSSLDKLKGVGISMAYAFALMPPIISHFLFADDCFLFSRAGEREAQVMKNILVTYESASSQAISLPKSEVYYCSNVQAPFKDTITNIIDVRAIMDTSKYFCPSSMVGQSKEATFGFIKIEFGIKLIHEEVNVYQKQE